MKIKKGVPLHCFDFLKEVAFMNHKVFYIEYDGSNSFDILYSGSRKLPRKKKKKLRKMINAYNHVANRKNNT